MLKQRLITAAVLIPLVVCIILFLPTAVFKWVLACVTLLAAWEWFSVIGFKKQANMLFAYLALFFIVYSVLSLAVIYLLVLTVVFWSLVSLFISFFAGKPMTETMSRLFTQPAPALLISTFPLALFGVSSVELHSSSDMGPQQFLYILVLVWLADTGGYFAGKRWGKITLAKSISPNKTWEGVAGAVVLGVIWAFLAYYLGLSDTVSLISWLSLSIVSIAVSVVGDLFESVFKRCNKIKDSGSLLPGHGGMLDRIDSLIAAVPVFTVGLYYLGGW